MSPIIRCIGRSVLLVLLCCGGAEEDVFEVGYSAAFFYDVDANDARTTTQVRVEECERLAQKGTK